MVNELERKESKPWHFQPGNPGRPKGAKSPIYKLRDTMLKAIEGAGKDLEKKLRAKGKTSGADGSEAFMRILLGRAATKSPSRLMATIVSMFPKEVRAELSQELVKVLRFEVLHKLEAGQGTPALEDSGNGTQTKRNGIPGKETVDVEVTYKGPRHPLRHTGEE